MRERERREGVGRGGERRREVAEDLKEGITCAYLYYNGYHIPEIISLHVQLFHSTARPWKPGIMFNSFLHCLE